jgi:hypothetical protein
VKRVSVYKSLVTYKLSLLGFAEFSGNGEARICLSAAIETENADLVGDRLDRIGRQGLLDLLTRGLLY